MCACVLSLHTITEFFLVITTRALSESGPPFVLCLACLCLCDAAGLVLPRTCAHINTHTQRRGLPFRAATASERRCDRVIGTTLARRGEVRRGEVERAKRLKFFRISYRTKTQQITTTHRTHHQHILTYIYAAVVACVHILECKCAHVRGRIVNEIYLAMHTKYARHILTTHARSRVYM